MKVWLRCATKERENAPGFPPVRVGDVLEVHRIFPTTMIESDFNSIFAIFEADLTEEEITAYQRDERGVPAKNIDPDLLAASIDAKDAEKVADAFNPEVYVGELARLVLPKAALTPATKTKAEVEAEK